MNLQEELSAAFLVHGEVIADWIIIPWDRVPIPFIT